MNKRIRELAEQANLITHKVPNGLAHLHTEQDVEKFAELIVMECSRVIKNGGYFNSAFGERRQATLPEIVQMIEDYFGVK